jgi:hypothetical protein
VDRLLLDRYGPAAMRAWHKGTLGELLERQPKVVAAELAAAAAARRLAPNPESLGSWISSIEMLRDAAGQLIEYETAARDWYYFLEFEVPRRSRRMDAAVIARDVVFFLEWKIGATQFERSALWQVEQYALDMRDFHEGSRDRPLVPFLVASNARASEDHEPFDETRQVQPVQTVNPAELPLRMYSAWGALHQTNAAAIDPIAWEDSAYRPTPSIIEAARMLYEQHDVRELSLSGADNLDATVQAVLDLIETCRREGRRGVAFITGAPGSGKTLAGLQVVHTPELMGDQEAAGVFLSGNMPLVEVISAALAHSAVRGGRRRRDANREVTAFIQHAYAFRNEYAQNPERIPSEHVILFDEAQRAWDAEQVSRWTRGISTRSEPRTMLDVMSRVPDWAVVIAMVGSGQEINRGEAGLGEWGRALEAHHPDWIVRASPAVLPGAPPPPGGLLFGRTPPQGPTVQTDGRLHLRMNMRSPRAERLNEWVDALLDLRVDDARRLRPDSREFPMAVTRSLEDARAWLQDRSDEGQRIGLVASSEARRLRAWGLDTRTLRQERAWADWFLRERGDVRGSHQLEVAATNFDCQGLEIDWAGVCWGNDFVPEPQRHAWRTRRFVGSRWVNAFGDRARFLLNGYRVILTRARRGQVLWVPQPDRADPTLDPVDFDSIADLLKDAGVDPIP